MSDFDLEAVKKDHVDECHICNPGELYPNDCDLAATIAELEAYRRAVEKAMHELNKGELWDALNTLDYLVHRRHL